MSPSKIASLAIGLLGLFVIVKALPYIQSLAWSLFTKSFSGVETSRAMSYQIFLLSIVLITGGFGVILIIFRQSFGNYLLGKKFMETEKPVSAYYYHSAAISIVGIYFIVHGASGFIGRIIPDLLMGNGDISISLALSPGIEFILGFCLFFGSRPLTIFWNRIKNEWDRK